MTISRTQPRAIPPHGTDDKRHIAEVLRNIYSGRLDWGGEFTLTTSASTTTVIDTRVNVNKVVVWSPMTTNAAAALANTRIESAGYQDGQFVLTHANNGQTDRIFRYIVMG